MKPGVLNLAARPFSNERPVLRTAALLWIVALGLVVLNGMLWARHLSSQKEQSEALAQLETRIAAESAEIRALRDELDRFDVKSQNAQVQFLNYQIARRIFSWSSLFDRLAEVLPETVQLRRISPRMDTSDKIRRSRRESGTREMVSVEMAGVAQSGEALLQLVDALFAHPDFVAPDLANESIQADKHEFSLSVVYLPPGRTEPDASAEGASQGSAEARVSSTAAVQEEGASTVTAADTPAPATRRVE